MYLMFCINILVNALIFYYFFCLDLFKLYFCCSCGINIRL